MFIRSLYRETQAGREILFVAEHNVDAFGDLFVHFQGALLAANAFPKGRAVVQIVRNDCAMFFGCSHSLDDQLWRGLAQRREDAPGVKPPDTELAENVVPIEIAGLELAGCRIAAIWNSDRAANSKTPLGEVQAVSDRASDAVVRNPLDEISVHTTLKDEIFEQTANLVVSEKRADGRF